MPSIDNNQPTILVFAPHPDDEVLGCGGVIAKYSQRGCKVFLCIVTKAYEPEWSSSFIKNRPKEIKKASEILGIKEFFTLDFPTVKLDGVGKKKINDAFRKIILETQPDIVFVPFSGDLSHDHQITHEAVLVAARPGPKTSVTKILAYETPETAWGTRPFQPTVYEDIELTLATKLEAMKVYQNEVREFPQPRSLKGIEYLARKRGSEVCLEAAEAFMLIRSIER